MTIRPKRRSPRHLAAMIRLSGAAFVSMALLPATAGAQPVLTTEGPVEGVTLSSGVKTWLGIPFAAPPVGDLRWKAPQAPAPHDAVQSADHFGPACMQPLRNHAIAYYVGDDPMAEDCLTLNIWAPATVQADARLPVIVYIHGGSFVAGSSRKPLYLGDRLAERGAIVVGINYRLGLLGFMASPELSAESSDHVSGNYGLMDQIAALRWVQANIGRFGGDPERVTIMGHSAGSMAISVLQASPAARGLFQRIVALSGSIYTSGTTDRLASLPEAQEAGKAIMQKLGVADLATLRNVPADKLVAIQGPLVLPIVDGKIVPESPAALYAQGKVADVPIMLGTARDEAMTPLALVRTVAAYRQALQTAYGDRAAAVERLYPATTDAEAVTSARALAHDIGFSTMMRGWSMMQAAHGRAPVYAYWFERRHPYRPGVTFSDLDPVTTGVNHTDDVPYWLGTFDSLNGPRITRDWTDSDRMLGRQMQDALLAFAADGKPGTDWPRYDGRAERMRDWGGNSAVVQWPDRQRMDALAALGIPEPRTASGR